MNDLAGKELEYQKALAAANQFTYEDLLANRQGQMTERQKSKFKKQKNEAIEHYEGFVFKDSKMNASNFGFGPILPSNNFGRDKNYYYKCDNGVRLQVSEAGYDILDEYHLHYVYYTSLTHTLLSVQVIPDDKPDKFVPKFGQL